MIARLHGLLAEIGEEDAVVDVSGVGYLVRCASRTLSRLPPVGEEVLLHIETLQGEQTGIRLFGFLTREERRAFVLLQGVQGVGPKAALAVLDIASPGELAAAIAREDKALVGRAQGVGPKLAQRIVVELKDKPISDGPVVVSHGQAAAPAQPAVTLAGEAVAALMGLGVAEVLARRAVDQAVLRLGDDAEVGAVIKAALQELGR
jgi:Holliday junction DNA helicase RuvA